MLRLWNKLKSLFKRNRKFVILFQNKDKITVDYETAKILMESINYGTIIIYQSINDINENLELVIKLDEIICIQLK